MHNRERNLGILFIVLALAIIGIAAGYVFANWQPELALDADHCPRKPQATWMVGVDHTSIWPPVEQERITRGLRAIAERLRKHERLDLHLMTDRPEAASAPWQKFQKCKSADPASVNAVNANETLVRAEYERDFLKPLESLLPELAKGRNGHQSPILEAIEIMMWSPHFRADVPARTLVLYSDFLPTNPFRDACVAFTSGIGTRLKGHNWQGVRVILEYLRNPSASARQGPAHLRSWAHLFYRLGAAEVFDGTTLILNDTTPCRSPSTTPRAQHHVPPNRNR
jgi:hypothetical protein